MAKKFCIVPWQELYSTSIGTFRMCCDEEDNRITRTQQTIVDEGIDNHWNSEYMKESRKIFLSDKLHPNCGRCWADEDNGKISLRMRRNQRYLGVENDRDLSSCVSKFESITGDDGHLDTSYINGAHLSVGNTCQLRCTHCGPAYSNNVAKEYIKLGWTDSENTRRSVFTDKYLGVSKQKILDADLWPQIKDISKNLKFLSFTGGEPSINRGLENLLEWLVDQTLSENIDIHITTNAVTINKQWIDLLSKFKKTEIRVSVDGSGDLENYVRYPTNWNRKVENIKQIKSRIDNVVLFTTIYSLNICGYKNFLEETKNLDVRTDLSLLSWPAEFDIKHLPDDLKKKLMSTFINLIKQEKDFLLKNGMESVIRRLAEPRDPGMWQKAVETIHQYDSVRPNKLSKISPELAPYLN
jgi:sulfatase maturation enzyme AslB (radical SAM superfamily)